MDMLNLKDLEILRIEENDFDVLDELVFNDLFEHVKQDESFTIFNKTKQKDIRVRLTATLREREILIQGGYLNYAKSIA